MAKNCITEGKRNDQNLFKIKKLKSFCTFKSIHSVKTQAYTLNSTFNGIFISSEKNKRGVI